MRIKLSTNGIKSLHKAINSARTMGDLMMTRRCSALLLLHEGVDFSLVAKVFGFCVRSIKRWLAAFLSTQDAKALKPKKPKGRPSKLSKYEKRELIEQLNKGPETLGYPTGIWTSTLIQDHIARTFKVFYSVYYISQLMRNMGFTYTKPKFHYAQKPKDFVHQLDWIRVQFPELYARVKDCGGVILFQDESSFQLQSNTAKTWSLRGETQLVAKNPTRKHIKVYGAIELFSGETTYSICTSRMNPFSYADFLRKLHNKYSPRPVFVVCDNAPYHGGAEVRRLLATSIELELVKLPKRAPHLNPIEKLWKQVKRNRIHNRYFGSIEALKSAVIGGLRCFQRNKDQVKSLMVKWLQLGEEAKAAKSGDFDSSFIPKKQILAYNRAAKKNVDNLQSL